MVGECSLCVFCLMEFVEIFFLILMSDQPWWMFQKCVKSICILCWIENSTWISIRSNLEILNSTIIFLFIYLLFFFCSLKKIYQNLLLALWFHNVTLSSYQCLLSIFQSYVVKCIKIHDLLWFFFCLILTLPHLLCCCYNLSDKSFPISLFLKVCLIWIHSLISNKIWKTLCF